MPPDTRILEPGCYLDGARGHYITRDAIWLAEEFGYILDPIAQYALARYDRDCHEDDYPYDSLGDIIRDVEDWLNCGPNEGIDRPIKGQNSPPAIPDDHYWGFNDGDFGLWPHEEED